MTEWLTSPGLRSPTKGTNPRPPLLLQITDNYTGRRWQRDQIALPPFTDWERFMCKKCAQLDEKIVHCKALSRHITDQFTLDGIANLIGQYEAEKRELHPNKE
jgi:hypothetical protein